MSEDESRDVPFTLALIAGGAAGITVDVALYPLDTLRTRLQAPEGFFKAGGFSKIYTGVVATALGAAPGAAFFFSAYEGFKPLLKYANGGTEHPIQHSCAAAAGEVAACLVRVPTAVVTQRMQVGQYSHFSEAVMKIGAENGIMTFYTGYWTTVAREIPFSFIQFPLYEGLKKAWRAAQGYDTTPMQGAACGSLAGAISSAATTPLDVAKTRMMIGAKSATGELYADLGGWRTLQIIAREEGIKGLFSGIGPRVGWITLGGYVFFGAYEKAQDFLWKSGVWGTKPFGDDHKN